MQTPVLTERTTKTQGKSGTRTAMKYYKSTAPKHRRIAKFGIEMVSVGSQATTLTNTTKCICLQIEGHTGPTKKN